MKAAILTNRADSFNKPMAEGLSRMLTKVGVESTVLYDGLAALPRKQVTGCVSLADWKGKMRNVVKQAEAWSSYRRLLHDLRNVDFAVIVETLPGAFRESFFDDDRLRQDVPHLPIILYDVIYLATRPYWAKWLLENNAAKVGAKGRHWGLDRYDYLLCATEISEDPVPTGADKFSAIGINFEDPSLFVESNKPFMALIDFEQAEQLPERAIQVLACIEADVPFKVLHGRYSIADIRAIYRRASVYFLASRESFGLPVCEVQACGALVLTPYPDWCPSHYLERPSDGIGRLPKNFIVYNNDLRWLIHELKRLKKDHDPQKTFANFMSEQPHFYSGNIAELGRFVDLVKNGEVTSQSHKLYPNLGQLVRLRGSC